MLRDLGVTLIAADSPSSFLDDGPTSKLIRQILGAVSEFDKAMIVAKLKGARDRARRAHGKCEGRKAYAERERWARASRCGGQLRGNSSGRPQSLRKIAANLAQRGYITPSGRPCSASAIVQAARARGTAPASPCRSCRRRSSPTDKRTVSLHATNCTGSDLRQAPLGRMTRPITAC